MTCIVAVSDGSRVWMAADSQVSDNGHKLTLAASKIVRHGGALFACDGSAVMGDALRYHMPNPIMKGIDSEPLAQWASLRFAPWLKGWCKENGVEDKRDGEQYRLPGSTLIAHKAEMCVVGRDGAIIQRANRAWLAIGSGRPEASGVLWLLHRDMGAGDYALLVEQAARLAVYAACEMDDGCGPPVVVEWTAP